MTLIHCSFCENVLGKRIAVGYENGAIKIFDIKASKVLHIINYETSHTFAVTCIHASHDNNLLISGDLNGRIVLSSSQSGKVSKVISVRIGLVVCLNFIIK